MGKISKEELSSNLKNEINKISILSGNDVEEKANKTDLDNLENTVSTHLDDYAHLLGGGTVYNATLQNGWSGSAYYQKNDLGQVNFRGNLTVGVTATGTVICTLPAGYRPRGHLPIVAAKSNTVPYDSYAGMFLHTNGNVVLRPPLTDNISEGNPLTFNVIFQV